MDELNFKFSMPDDETLARYIPIKGEKGERGDPTKTSQLENDSDFTTNAALTAGLATKADDATVQGLSSQVSTNTSDISTLNKRKIAKRISTGANPQYALVATLWARSNTGSAGSFTIHGRIGGWQSNRTNHIDVTIGNRGGIQARGSFYGNSPLDDSNWVDVLVFHDEQDDTDSVYLCAKGYAAMNVDVAPTSPITILYDDTWSTDVPSGTLAYSLLADDTYVQKNLGGTISADIDGDAATVNGHTVNADVPNNAVFTDTIYDDTAIHNELNTKLSISNAANTYATKTEIQSLASGSPLVASSVSGMTDTTRTYVNTSDGNWYYYDGSAWVIGGVYQAAEITGLDDDAMASKSLTTKAVQFYKGYNLKDDYVNQRWGWIQSPMQLQQNGYIAANSSISVNNKCVTTPIPANSWIRIEKSNTSGRFRVGLCDSQPANGMTATLIFENTAATNYTFFNANAAWLVVYFSHTSAVGDATIDVYVDSRNDVKDSVRSDALGVFETVDSDNLCIEDLKVVNYGTDRAVNHYRYGNINNYRSYVFPLEPNTEYTIAKNGGNRFRVCLWRSQPVAAPSDAIGEAETYLNSHPSAVVIDDDAATTCTFNSGLYLWCTILYSNAAEDSELTITTGDNTRQRLARQYTSDLVPVAKPIYPQWDKWADVRYYYGFDKNTQPIFNTVKGVLESDTMISVRGGKGRWNSAFAGGHVFEGWSKDELFRLTMLIGKFSQAMACIQTYSPAGLSEASRRFGWVKVGSDEQNKGTDFAKGWTKFYTPVTLQSRSTAPTSVEDCDLNPQLSSYSDNVPVGTMYYDSNANKVRVYTPSGWQYLAFE